MLFALTLLAFALAIFMIRPYLQATGERPSTPARTRRPRRQLR
ncbi:MAG: hypothetical protein R2838_15365 [Caldilineaceae bacterium]